MNAISQRARRGRVDVGVDAGDRGGVLYVLALVVALGDLLRDPVLLLAGGGELVGVLERAGELLAGAGGFAQRLDALGVEPSGELGERLDTMLELADQRQAGARKLRALQRRWRGRQAVERQG